MGVFGRESNLKIGLECIVKGIDSTPSGSEVTRYIISLMALERKLSGRKDAMSQLGDRIQMIDRQLDHFDLLDEQMLSNLASIYLDVISPIGPRIQVTGTPSVLQQINNQHKVRAFVTFRYSQCCFMASSGRQKATPNLWTKRKWLSKLESY